MSTRVSMRQSVIVAAAPRAAYDHVLPLPLPELFTRRFLAIPPIKRVEDAPAVWDTVGQSRTIVLTDGGRMRETLTDVTPGRRFGYRIDRLRGPMSPLVKEVDGLWSFDASAAGTSISWAWEVTPSAIGRPIMPAFRAMWERYAARNLASLTATLGG